MAAPFRFVYLFYTGFQDNINTIHLSKLKNLQQRINIISFRNASYNVDSFQYCMDSVRKYDYENYLACLLLPKNIRTAAFVIRAFNIEVSQVRDLVSTAAIGEMRFKFWHDTLNRTYDGNPPDQPIAMELKKVLKKHKLSKAWFQRLIVCREQKLNDKPFLSMEDLEEYCDKSIVSVYFLILQALDAANIHSDHVASHIGRSQGICNLIRGIPFNASKRRVFLPLELTSKHQISHQDIISGNNKQGLQDVVFELSSTAHQHLLLARKLSKDIANDIKPVFLPAVATAAYLKNLEKSNFDVFHPKNQRRNSWLPLMLLYHKLRKSY